MTTDRTQQVNWIDEVAQDLTSNGWEGTPEELVEYWIGQAEMPEWFDEIDRQTLVEFVERHSQYGI